MMIRQAQVAGSFYPAKKHNLEEQIKASFLSSSGPGSLPSEIDKSDELLCGLIVPHAGYIYSGAVAAWAYLKAAQLKQFPKTVILIGPNHTGRGKPVSVYPQGMWSTPLGNLEIDKNLTQKIANADFELDETGHLLEHSIEVQLPFLQYSIEEEFQIVCISMLDQSLKTAVKLAEKISNIVDKHKSLLIASSDLTHYEPEQSTNQKDEIIINAMKSGQVEDIYNQASEISCSACGLGPATAVIKACKLLKANKVSLLKYETSAAATSDSTSVVGYAALAIN